MFEIHDELTQVSSLPPHFLTDNTKLAKLGHIKLLIFNISYVFAVVVNVGQYF